MLYGLRTDSLLLRCLRFCRTTAASLRLIIGLFKSRGIAPAWPRHTARDAIRDQYAECHERGEVLWTVIYGDAHHSPPLIRLFFHLAAVREAGSYLLGIITARIPEQ